MAHKHCHCGHQHNESHQHYGGHQHRGGHQHEHEDNHGSLWRLAVTAVLLLAAVWAEHSLSLTTWQQLLIYLVPYIIVGYITLREAVEGICNGEPFNEHLLMSVATIGALLIGFLPGAETEFPEAVFVMMFFQVGELFEGYAEGRSRESISHLMDLRPDVAHVVVAGEDVEKDVHPGDVSVGQTILVHKGEKVPLDGIVTAGSPLLNTVALTGESAPRQAGVGDSVYSGSINMGSRFTMRTTKTFGESTVSKVLELVEHVGERKSKSEAFITRFAHIYTPVVVLVALLLAVAVPLLLWVFCQQPLTATFPTWLYRALLFLVVSCPCALVLSVPLTFFGGIGGASRQGILIKGSNYIDVLSKVRTVVFDKTGTLTHGVVSEVGSQVSGDTLKADAAEAMSLLRAVGVERMVMLSGDRREAVGSIAGQLPLLTEWYAELLPQDKVALFDRLMADHSSEGKHYVAFVGDGINDAPVLARADVGIAMGALGSDAAIEAADVVLMDDSPSKISLAIRIARRTLSIARQNVWLAISIKVAVLLLAAVGLATMWLAVFADVGVTVLAVLNAMRALRS